MEGRADSDFAGPPDLPVIKVRIPDQRVERSGFGIAQLSRPVRLQLALHPNKAAGTRLAHVAPLPSARAVLLGDRAGFLVEVMDSHAFHIDCGSPDRLWKAVPVPQRKALRDLRDLPRSEAGVRARRNRRCASPPGRGK